MKKNLRRFLSYLISLFVVLLISSLAKFLLDTSSKVQELFGLKTEKTHIGESFPNFNYKNHKGKWTSLDEISDSSYILIDFWFGGCKPCLEEMKMFPEILDEYGSGLKIVSISIDPFEQMQYIVQNRPKPWGILNADRKDWIFLSALNGRSDEVLGKMDVNIFPTYFILDENGTVVDRPVSALVGVEQLKPFSFSAKVFTYAWNKHSTKDKVKFYRAIFVLFNVAVIIIASLTYIGKLLVRKFKVS